MIKNSDYQVSACETFFVDDLPSGFQPLEKEDRPDNTKKFNGPIFDITGFDAQQVVGLLSGIVNDEYQFRFKTNQTFYLLIQGNPKDDLELFRLKAKPTNHQPGNGIVFVRPRGKKTFKRGGAKSYEQLNGALKAFYDICDDEGKLILSDTKSFAKHIKQLFKNNVQIDDLPQATSEAYMILLFEIARRLVKTENPSEKKQQLDILPIGSAIARLIQLLERGDKETCIFEDVFFKGYRFHCFTGTSKERRGAIDNINKAIFNITKEKAVTEEDYLKELQELFCSEQRLAKMPPKGGLEDKFKGLMSRRRPNLAFSSDSESFSAYDYCE